MPAEPSRGIHRTHMPDERSHGTARWHDAPVHLDRFADRLDPATYADDDEVVGVFESDPSEADALWLSARLFRRLIGVARAYELHALPLLDDPDPVRLNRARCEALLDEIAFVAERLDDPVAVGVAQSITDYLNVRTRRPGWDGSVTFEGDWAADRPKNEPVWPIVLGPLVLIVGLVWLWLLIRFLLPWERRRQQTQDGGA